jgi:hypothetical protein
MKATTWPTLLPSQATAVPARTPKMAPAAMAITMAGSMSTTPAM